MSALIDIDARPYVVVDTYGLVTDDASGPQYKPHSFAQWRTALARCVGQQIRVRIFRAKKKRTHEQNAYLWGVVYPDILAGLRQLAEDAGELPVFTDEDDLHDALKWAFLRRTYVLPGAGELEAMPRSSKLSVAEFSEYVDKVKRWAAEHHIWVREPHEAPLEATA